MYTDILLPWLQLVRHLTFGEDARIEYAKVLATRAADFPSFEKVCADGTLRPHIRELQRPHWETYLNATLHPCMAYKLPPLLPLETWLAVEDLVSTLAVLVPGPSNDPDVSESERVEFWHNMLDTAMASFDSISDPWGSTSYFDSSVSWYCVAPDRITRSFEALHL